ncbi:MAG: TrbC/VirB2 family protein, partial [Rickettsiales bacterium]
VMYLRLLSIVILASIFSVLFLVNSSLASDTVVGNMLCTTTSWVHGSMGQGISILAVIILGLLALFNKISWGITLIHIVGAALLVGASSIVGSLGLGIAGC